MALIRELNRRQIRADVLNITGDSALPEELHSDGVTFYNVFDSRFSSFDQLLKEHKLLALKAAPQRLLHRFTKSDSGKAEAGQTVRLAVNRLKKIGLQYDYLIAVCSHYINGMICDAYCKETAKPFLVYQLDPISTNQFFGLSDQMSEIELALYSDARAIITTPILAAEKQADPAYAALLPKVHPAEFPNVKDLTCADAPASDGKQIECFYSGRFYGTMRDCTFPLEVLSRVQSEQLQVVFAGDGQEDRIESYRGAFGERLRHLGMLPLDESFRKMQEADVLINIGNNVSNQVPSKLFDYISTGKPILNFCKIPDCPTIPYVNRYRLGLNVIEGADTLENQAHAVWQFIDSTRGARMRYEEIQTSFQENTAEYVGRLFAELLTDGVGRG
ncbi:MAG: hypothetical protein IK080_04930 [Clostridia bacterium]|nr:hypothetical protein [Clostridia bacterium]